VIIGAGPAGLSAAITARARGKDVCVVSNRPEVSPLARAQVVDNYPALPGISGRELLEQLLGHAGDMGAGLCYARVVNVLPLGATFSVTTSDDVVEARAVILALGATHTGATLPGEQEYLGRGVSYCATCDGMLWRDATVAVVGQSPDAVEEAAFLASLGATVHFVATRVSARSRAALGDGVVVHEGRALAIEGDAMGVTGLRVAEKGEVAPAAPAGATPAAPAAPAGATPAAPAFPAPAPAADGAVVAATGTAPTSGGSAMDGSVAPAPPAAMTPALVSPASPAAASGGTEDAAAVAEQGALPDAAKRVAGEEATGAANPPSAPPNEIVIACRGVFVLRPSIAPTALLPTLQTHDGYIATDAQMRASVPGVFAAGDCVGPPLQVAKAVGEGQRAALAAVEYLDAPRDAP
jgi:thioredoxin reductase (NADPH)